jgi:pyruvate,water dikinase
MAIEEHGQNRSTGFWIWRLQMAERIAAELDPVRFGVKAIYVSGSTKHGTAGPCSDIDLLVHFQGTQKQRDELLLWLEGWSLCLDEMNFSRTGHRTGGLLDVHLVTDEDIVVKSSYAVMIDSATDPARPLLLKNATPSFRPELDQPSSDPPSRT